MSPQSQKYLPFYLILIAVLIFFLLFSFSAGPHGIPVSVLPTPTESLPVPSPTDVQVLEAQDPEQTQPSEDLQATIPVVRVVDGDTVVVSLNGSHETVRLIGINTPETVDPRNTVQCFGREASNAAKSLLEHTSVSLEADPTQGDRDKYGRLLRYIFLTDGTSFNQLMIEEGYAYEYTYNKPYKYQQEFKAAQLSAQQGKKGLWNEAACNGKL
jgi:micrococcal nuclease